MLAAASATTGCIADDTDAPLPTEAAVGIAVDGCRPFTTFGSGMMYGPGLVLTSAHVLRGATSIEVYRDDVSNDATIVAFDPDMDLAVLAVDPALAPALALADPDAISPGARGTVVVFRDRSATVVPVRVRRRITINTEDIYIDADTARPGWELDADTQVGDSGGVVVVDGKAIGVLWSRSRQIESRAYAIDPVRAGSLIREQLAEGRLGDDVDLERCR